MASASQKRSKKVVRASPDHWIDRLFLKAWRPYGWLSLAAFLLYCRSLFFAFTYLDDNALILDNYRYLRDFPGLLLGAFRQDVFHLHDGGAFYRPLLTLSLGLDAQFGGTSPFAYHLSNVIIHIVAVCLVFMFVTSLGYARGAAFFAALVFAVHPALSQAVAWVPGRNDSLAAVFVLASFLQFVHFLETGSHRWTRYAAHLCLFALALFTKETTVMLPVVCLAYTVLLAKVRSRAAIGAAVAGWLAIAGCWYGLRQAALQNPLHLPLSAMARSIWISLPGFLQYLGKLLLPFNLSVLPSLQDTSLIYGVVAAVLVIAGMVLAPAKRWNSIAFGFCWFAVFLSPSFILHSTTVADFTLEHRIYLPVAGLLLVLLEIATAKRWHGCESQIFAASAAVVLALSCITWQHIGCFKDRMAFWGNAVSTSPHLPLAHRNLGAMYQLDGKFDEAEKEYLTTIALNPAEPMVHSNLGLVYMHKGKLNEAEKELRREVAINPSYDNGYANLALLCFKTRRFAEAEALWKQTLEHNPDHVDANADLAILYHDSNPQQSAFYLQRLKTIDENTYARVSARIAQQR